jgi:DNA-binding NtrC family response regulator
MPTNQDFAIIVEDDAYSVEVLGHFLEEAGLQYKVFEDAESVYRAAQSSPSVAIFFVDLELSTENGYDILKTIQDQSPWRGVPVVAYTSHLHQKSQARQSGFHSFLGKPLDPTLFPNQLQRMLNNQPVWD